jgi:hypothetical protein
MAYESTAVYNAVVAIESGYEPLGSTITAPAGASIDCAVVEAAYGGPRDINVRSSGCRAAGDA